MPQVLEDIRSPISTTATVPTALIEETALALLGVVITDFQDYIDECVPDGEYRWWVHHRGRFVGQLWAWGNRFDTPWSPIGSYSTLFLAATSFLGRGAVNSAYQQAHADLIDRFNHTPDYF